MSTERERLDEIGKKIKREPDTAAALAVAATSASASTVPADDHIPRLLGLDGALNTLTPCAACKLLRRRCAQECPFAPYFSPHEPHKFAAVHKVFGASNVSKMLLEVAEGERADAASSLVYEANLRMRDPVYGCMGAISMLQQQVNALEAELEAVRGEIIKHRYRQAAGNRLIDDEAHATASFVAPASAPVHVNDVVSVVEAGQEVAATGGASGMWTSSAVYVAEAEQPASTNHYSSLNPSEHPAYFG
ncbi:unnamed protein product [Miscanthus lutarioriparius]|uniref:LOB domain-containing protein n=1 Tax=Miscanthus lutarioriparius TaxID=422564 RepID=A0A811NT03_9POAL|nr:unnamed protein product [Miscanthus lutarioriparius]